MHASLLTYLITRSKKILTVTSQELTTLIMEEKTKFLYRESKDVLLFPPMFKEPSFSYVSLI